MHFTGRLKTYTVQTKSEKTQLKLFSWNTCLKQGRWAQNTLLSTVCVTAVWKSGSLWGVDGPLKIKEKARKGGKEGSKGKVRDSWIPSTLNAPTERQQLHFLSSKRETQCQWNRQRKAATYEKVSAIMVHQFSESKLTSAFVISNSQGISVLNNLAKLKGCRHVPFSVIDMHIWWWSVCKLVKWWSEKPGYVSDRDKISK